MNKITKKKLFVTSMSQFCHCFHKTYFNINLFLRREATSTVRPCPSDRRYVRNRRNVFPTWNSVSSCSSSEHLSFCLKEFRPNIPLSFRCLKKTRISIYIMHIPLRFFLSFSAYILAVVRVYMKQKFRFVTLMSKEKIYGNVHFVNLLIERLLLINQDSF